MTTTKPFPTNEERKAVFEAATKPVDMHDFTWRSLKQYGCCLKAKHVFCVCRCCISCPDHGTHCYGSHD